MYYTMFDSLPIDLQSRIWSFFVLNCVRQFNMHYRIRYLDTRLFDDFDAEFKNLSYLGYLLWKNGCNDLLFEKELIQYWWDREKKIPTNKEFCMFLKRLDYLDLDMQRDTLKLYRIWAKYDMSPLKNYKPSRMKKVSSCN